MKSAKSPGQIEPLESRIAPAVLLVGALNNAGTTDYDGPNAGAPIDPLFFHTNVPGGSVDVTAVGGDANTYYIKLKSGDQIQQFGNGGFTPLLTVTKGTLVAFFVDSTTSGVLNQVDPGELSGISLGSGAAFKLNKDLDGSILTNYDDKANTVVMTNLVGPKQSIAGIETGGSVTGGIYAGGSITKLSINGSVSEIFTGLAANGIAFDLLRGALNGGNGILAITAAAGEAGGAISSVEVRALTSLAAGGGGVGGKGGIVKDIKIFADDDSISIRGGDGGASVGGKSGGIGGDVTNVFVSGAADTTSQFVQILAGNGGGAAANTGGKGGDGGKIVNVFVGYDSVSGKPVASTGLLSNVVEIGAGTGGAAKVGGKGGVLTNVKVLTQTPDLLVNPFSVAPYETSVHAGNGGAPNDLSGGAAGIGGKVDQVQIVNQNTDVSTASNAFVGAGNGGTAANPNAKGADGGSITGVSVLGFNADISAGDGSSGITGGKGGSITTASFLTQDIILPNVINVVAGTGGDGSNGNAGKGGDVKTVKISNSNLKSLNINAPGTFGGNGGISTKGKGGDGGLVTAVDIIDGDNGTGPEFSGQFTLRSGLGGAGDKGGGKGGDVTAITFFAQDVGVDFASGGGGAATLDGSGGNGGKMSSINVSADGLFLGVQVNGVLKSGQGGAGLGKGKGGSGGDLSFINLNVDGDVSATAADGGAGTATSAGGQGGSLLAVGAFARDGSGKLLAGNAGAGGKLAKGGSISGTNSQLVGLRAATDLTIKAGVGSAGGDGGGISGLAFGSSFDSQRPTPSGNVLVQAGDGSAGAKAGGKGGSIINVSGNPSSGTGTTTTFIAGKGASVATKGGDGGSISEVILSGVGDDDVLFGIDDVTDHNTVEITFQAGDAGDGATAGTGAKGGQIKNLSINNLDPNAVLKSVAAGNGGLADPVKGKGGQGGTIDGVRVVGGTDPATGATLNADIGYRSGKVYGYTSMGGLFAGLAGAGAKAALAGSVRNISADSIAAIVAGRDDAPQAVELVEKISLNGLSELQTGLTSPFAISYPLGGTTGLLTLTDPLSVQTAVNALLAPSPDTVKITRTTAASFVITNTAFGDIAQYTGEEYLDTDVVEVISGQHSVLVKTKIPGTLVTKEVESFKPENNGSYVITYAGSSSAPLAFNTTAAAIQAELNNNVATIVQAGGVTVTDNGNGFDVRFNQNGDRELLNVVADVSEVQRIDTLGVGEFQILVQKTVTFTPPLPATPFTQVFAASTIRLASNASPADVKAAVDNAFAAVDVAAAGAGGTTSPATVTVAADPADATAYVVRFDQSGQQFEFIVTEFAPLAAATVIQGTGANAEVQTLNFVPRAAFSSTAFAAANVVGAIVDPNEVNASVFKFTNVVGAATFEIGDKPIDGLIVAKALDQATLNFTPEAAFIGAGPLFDNDNKI